MVIFFRTRIMWLNVDHKKTNVFHLEMSKVMQQAITCGVHNSEMFYCITPIILWYIFWFIFACTLKCNPCHIFCFVKKNVGVIMYYNIVQFRCTFMIDRFKGKNALTFDNILRCNATFLI